VRRGLSRLRVGETRLLNVEIISQSLKSLTQRIFIMCAYKIDAGRPAYYSIRKAAWILGVDQSRVARAIRLGTLRAVRRNGHVVVPTRALTRLLGPGTRGAPW
jgi:hypothetical protein